MRRWSRSVCLILVTGSLYAVSSWLALQTTVRHPWYKRGTCSDEESIAFLSNLCKDYLNGMVGGSLCEPLCVGREVEFIRCLGHGVKAHVLLAQWAANYVVLKMTEPVRNHSVVALHVDWYTDRHRLISKKEFVHKANTSLFLNLGGGRHVASTLTAVERVFAECDVLGDGQLSYTEALVCWSLLETDEFVLLSVLSGVSAIPDVYGACGNMYAMQYATSQPLLAWHLAIADRRSWHFRARLAIALLEMIRSIESSTHGTLLLCDMKAANLGVVRRPGTSQLIGKAIDLDLSWFRSALINHRKMKYCQKDSDCAYVDCLVACNLNTHTCSGPILTNNLQVLCAKVLGAPTRLQSPLLRDPPVSVRRQLRTALQQCTVSSSSSSSPRPRIIMNTLLSLLHDSMAIPHTETVL